MKEAPPERPASRLQRVWYVTRKYPPSVGGMQLLAEQIATALDREGAQSPVVIALGRGQWLLPAFLFWAALRILYGRARGQIAVLYLGDPVLSALGALVRGAGIPVLVTVHGRDVLYANPVYQAYLRRCFWHRFDGYVAISRFVADVLREHGIAPERVEVAPLGIEPTPVPKPVRSVTPTLLYLGRLQRRKGVAWFVESVCPGLFAAHPSARLLVVGAGPERARIAQAIVRAKLGEHVELRGLVAHEDKARLLAECDAVVMPNMLVAGDAEGFGLVALEAGRAGKVVFAADVEGLRDAVREGENGWLLPAGDADAWTGALAGALADRTALALAGERARSSVLTHYAWPEVGRRYARFVDKFRGKDALDGRVV